MRRLSEIFVDMAKTLAGACSCTLRERESGHKTGCWYPDWQALVDEAKGAIAQEEAAARLLEKTLANEVAQSMHAIARALSQEYEATEAFVKRVFEKVRVKPDPVAPYLVSQPEQPVTDGRLFKEDALGVTSQKVRETADRSGGVPDITK